jgi:hypothetical protein
MKLGALEILFQISFYEYLNKTTIDEYSFKLPFIYAIYV